MQQTKHNKSYNNDLMWKGRKCIYPEIKPIQPTDKSFKFEILQFVLIPTSCIPL